VCACVSELESLETSVPWLGCLEPQILMVSEKKSHQLSAKPSGGRNIHNNTRTQLHPRGGGGGGGADRAGCCHRRLPIVVCTGKAYRQPKTSVCVCCTRCRSRRVSRASIMRPITYPERHPPKTGAHHKQLFGLVCTYEYISHAPSSQHNSSR
jgi:hypothetical protein